MKNTLLSLLVCAIFISCTKARKEILPIPSKEPSEAQLKQIERKYGMFIHFGINTFHDMEWTDGSKPTSSYTPSTIDADQWIKTAKDAGMKYVILITKHHEGFALWDSKYTEYDVATSGNTTNVVEEVAKACKKYNIGLGLYYSLWDRNYNADVENVALDSSYNSYMINQLEELLEITKPYTNIVEFWFDGGWVKENNRWPINEIYQTIKSQEPDCQVGINWTIGLPGNPDYHKVIPEEQQEGYPIRYFPSDFRLGDPFLPKENDPKIFTHNNEEYYMPWESTVCISKRWFYNTQDTVYKPIDELVELYNVATAQDNILILNCPPGRDGKIRSEDIQLLTELKERLNIDS
ncbi:alpha-L-fucosidase [Algoriphagus aquimarinus]|uniref:alpha-L-fucosidase n=1 Tax=Algoriphagus aquimarinus TaxID=237018 RepID=A0A1I1C3C3_9BACT|nr:alpha-L-fucosidase [Algoriphagus aquimarinus]SFB56612.1 alpha-L-fucosidase [Algoriphagus aquimarinus]